MAEFSLSRFPLGSGSLRIQKTCGSDFSSSASLKVEKCNGNQACSAAQSATQSALKLVDLSTIGQILLNCTRVLLRYSEVQIEIRKKERIFVLLHFLKFVRSSRLYLNLGSTRVLVLIE